MREDAEQRLVELLGADAVGRLGRSTCALIGTGLLGGSIAFHLAQLGVGQVVLVDSGRVDLPNLGNQTFPAVAVGEAKVTVRARQLKELNPRVAVQPIHAPVEALGLARLSGVDLLVGALDSRRSRVRVNEISLRLGLPWVDCAVDGTGRALLGTVACYDPRLPESACYLCRLDARALSAVSLEGRPAGCPSWRAASTPLTPPTLASSAFGSVVAGFATLRCIDVLLGRAPVGTGRLLLVQGRPAGLREAELRRSPHCLHDHQAFHPLRVVGDATLGALLETAARDLGREPSSLGFGQRSLALGLVCPACGSRRERVRLTEAFSDADVRCDCRRELEMVPARITDRLSGSEARRLADLRLVGLGLPEDDVVTAEAEDRVAFYRVNSRAPLGEDARREAPA